jgi:predicted metal-binding membrane protein
MLVLLTVGVMNLAWMTGLAAVVFLEKTWRHGKGFSIAVGVALIVFACFVPWNHGLVPGLYMTGMTM